MSKAKNALAALLAEYDAKPTNKPAADSAPAEQEKTGTQSKASVALQALVNEYSPNSAPAVAPSKETAVPVSYAPRNKSRGSAVVQSRIAARSAANKERMEEKGIGRAQSVISNVGRNTLGGVEGVGAMALNTAKDLDKSVTTQRNEALLADYMEIAATARRNIEMMLADGDYSESEMSSQRNILADAEEKISLLNKAGSHTEHIFDKPIETLTERAKENVLKAAQHAEDAKAGLGAVGSVGMDAALMLGNMAPAMAVSAIGTPAAGAAFLGATSGGRAYTEKLLDGSDEKKARAYGAIIGTLEGGLQYLTGGISKLAGKRSLASNLDGKIAAMRSGLQKAAAYLALHGVSEIGEEEAQLFLEPLVNSIIYGVDYEAPKIEEIAYTALITALSTGVLEAPNALSFGSTPSIEARVPQNTPPNAVASRTEIGEGNLPPATQNAPQAQETVKEGDTFAAAVRQQYAPSIASGNELIEAVFSHLDTDYSLTNSDLMEIVGNKSAIDALGIDASLIRSTQELRASVERAVFEKYHESRRVPSIYKSRDEAGGWGRLYSSSERVLTENIGEVNPELAAELNAELDAIHQEGGKVSLPIFNTFMALSVPVRQDVVLPIDALRFVSDVYNNGGIEAVLALTRARDGNLTDAAEEQLREIANQRKTQAAVSQVMTSEAHRLFGSQETSTPQSVGNENTFDAPTEQAYTESIKREPPAKIPKRSKAEKAARWAAASPQARNIVERLNNLENLSIEEIMAIPEIAKAKVANESGVPTIKLPNRENIIQTAVDALYSRGSYSGEDASGADLFDGEIDCNHRMDIVIGLPGSGKSSAYTNELSQTYHERIIDTDDAREWIPEYTGENAALVHEEASKIRKAVQERALRRGENILLSTIGDNAADLMERIEGFVALGYEVHLHLNELPNNKSIARAIKRYIEEGRYVSPELIFAYGNGPTRAFLELTEMEGVYGKTDEQRSAGLDGNGAPHPRGGNRNAGQTSRRKASLASYDWKNNDVAFGEKPRLIFDSKAQTTAPTAKTGVSPDDSVGAAPAGFSPYYDMEAAYGVQEGGVNAVRPDDAPISTNGQDLVSRSVVSAKGAAVTPDAFVPLLENDTVNGEYSYFRVSNNALVRQAQNFIMRRGWDNALEEWREAAWGGNYTPRMNVVGQLLYNNAVNSGDFDLARDIFSLYQRTVRTNAQVVQSARVLKNLSPQTRLYMIEQQMQGVSEEMRANAADNVPVEEWMTRVGEELAAYMERYGVNSTQARTTAQIVADDVRHFYAKDRSRFASRTRRAGRSELDRITDLFRNREEYGELWDAARAKVERDLGDSNPDALTAFEEWLDNAPNYAERLSFELTKNAGLHISDEAAAAYLGAQTEAERDAALTQMQKEVGAQLPSTFADKWTALRYVNMLGNFKTQGRNIAGNVGMQALTRTKDATATLLEGLAYAASGGRFERTKALFPGKERVHAAKDDFANVREIALGGGRYDINEGRNTENDFMRGAMDERIIFKGKSGQQNIVHKTLEAYRKATNKAMERGDEIFSKESYAHALAGYLKVHNVTAEQFASAEWRENNAGFVDAARAYAITEAQEATFRDNNAVSEWVSKLGRGKQTSTFGKVMSAVGEGLLPFRKTPANVAVRAEEYSPLGLINTAVKAVQLHRGAENVTGADVINQLAKTITGTGVLALGWALAKSGRLRGGDRDDEEQQYFDELNGHQNYALELPNGTSYTLDWATPAAMPLFMGAELAELSTENGIELGDIFDALSTLTDPMLEMSMLSSVNELLEKLRYGETSVIDLGGSLLVSYLTQGLTNTLLGQMERTTETERMSTFVDKESPLPDWLQREIGKASAKTPIWDYHQHPYIDPWGRTEDSGSVVERGFENFLSPGYSSTVTEGALERELQRLAEARENTAIFPDLAPKSFKVGKETHRLTQDEYVDYAKQRGQQSEALVRALIGSGAYKTLTDEQKEDAISKAYEFANAEAKEAVSDYKVSESSWIIGARESELPLVDYLLTYEREGGSKYLTGTVGEKMDAAVAVGMSREDYIALRENIDANGNGAVSQAEAKAYLDASDLSQEQKRKMWNIINAGWKKNPY